MDNNKGESSKDGAQTVGDDVPESDFAQLTKTVQSLAATVAALKGKRPRVEVSGLSSHGEKGDEGLVPKKRRKADKSELETIFESDSEEEEELDEELNGDEEPESDEYLTSMASMLDDPDKCGPAVGDTLGTVVDKMFTEPLSKANAKDTVKKYHKPSNCKKVLVPRVNPEMWKRLTSGQKSTDARMTLMQNSVVKASVAVVTALDQIRPKMTPESRKEVRVKLADAAALLGRVSHDISVNRRSAMKAALPRKFADVFGSSIPVTKWLFGDEIVKSMKDAKKFDDALPKYNQDRFHSWSKNGGRNQNQNRYGSGYSGGYNPRSQNHSQGHQRGRPNYGNRGQGQQYHQKK